MEQLVRELRRSLPDAVRPRAARGRVTVVAEADPLAVWGRLLGALAGGATAALLDPAWPDPWQASLRKAARGFPDGAPPAVLIPTSGSSGEPKLCIHDAATLRAAAEGYAARFGARGIVHATGLLPAHHVGGLMPALRAAACGGRVHFADYRDAASVAAAPFAPEEAALSLVPTQLSRMLENPETAPLLPRFGAVLLGGAACPPGLLAAARAAGLRLAPCYGATETAAMVTALDPEAFREGAAGVGTPLPHARIEVDAGRRVRVHSPSNLRQYLPAQEGFCRAPFATGDLGRIDAAGRLHILGRADRVIITGGEKVHPEQVEAAALGTGLAAAAFCAGVPDPEWGQRVVLRVAPAGEAASDWQGRLLAQIREHLPAYAVPRQILPLEDAERPPAKGA